MENYDVDDDGVPNMAVAVSESRNCKSVVKWALGKFVPEGINYLRLLHVCPKLPTITRDDDALARRREMEWKISAMLLPYTQMCSERQVDSEPVIVEADDVAMTISEQIIKFRINKLVIGSSSRGGFARKFKSEKLSARIVEYVPSFCTVFEVSKGKLLYLHKAKRHPGDMFRDDTTRSSISSNGRSSHGSSARLDLDTDSASNITQSYSPHLQIQRDQAIRAVNQVVGGTRMSSDSILQSGSLSTSYEDDAASCSSGSAEIQSAISRDSSYRSIRTDFQSWNSDITSAPDHLPVSVGSENPIDYNLEIERLRIELKNLQGMIDKTQNDTVSTSQKAHELSARRAEDEKKLEELYLQDLKAKELAWEEIKAREAAERDAEFVRECAEREKLQREEAEENATRDAQEKELFERALINCQQQYKTFEWQEIVAATSEFAEALKIGSGANGTVYKGNLHHTTVAIKVLHSNEGHCTKQFKQELEVLGRIRHPHLLLLLGACPEHGCLIYEYMENGNLAERIDCKNNMPPLQWFQRFRIAWEVASALLFLHNTKPKPIVHRDLKPANILLDRNLVSKIGDVGLSTLLPSGSSPMVSMGKQTAPVGTFAYIDPEYQRTGVVSPKSDTYGLGMVVLQLLTGRSAMGLAHTVETALENGALVDILDTKAGKWPEKETQELVDIALRCAELRRSDRPELESEILPTLEKLKNMGNNARKKKSTSSAPSHFLCPILKEVMENPCVAADGYTYDRKAIELWIRVNNTSPLTSLPLPSKHLIPNYSLLSAIKEWQSGSHR